MISYHEMSIHLSYNHETGILTRIIAPSGGVSPGSVAGWTNKAGYLYVRVKGKIYAAHRIAWLLHYGDWPDGEIDHIDCNKANNKITNLRVSSRAGNVRNVGLRNDNSSGVKGVSWHKSAGKWVANIRVGGKKIYLGLFSDLSEAERVVISARKSMHGDYSRDS